MPDIKWLITRKDGSVSKITGKTKPSSSAFASVKGFSSMANRRKHELSKKK